MLVVRSPVFRRFSGRGFNLLQLKSTAAVHAAVHAANTRVSGARLRDGVTPCGGCSLRGGDRPMWHRQKGAYGGHTHATTGDAADVSGC